MFESDSLCLLRYIASYTTKIHVMFPTYTHTHTHTHKPLPTGLKAKHHEVAAKYHLEKLAEKAERRWRSLSFRRRKRTAYMEEKAGACAVCMLCVFFWVGA